VIGRQLSAASGEASFAGRSTNTRPTRRVLRGPLGYRFADGSSGPFGEDTPGPWMTFDQAVAELRRFTAGERATRWAA
jgi:hypothetical protein